MDSDTSRAETRDSPETVYVGGGHTERGEKLYELETIGARAFYDTMSIGGDVIEFQGEGKV